MFDISCNDLYLERCKHFHFLEGSQVKFWLRLASSPNVLGLQIMSYQWTEFGARILEVVLQPV
jgi:hypothetical protein